MEVLGCPRSDDGPNAELRDEKPAPSEAWSLSCKPLTFLEDFIEESVLRSDLANQCGKALLKRKPPGGRRSSSEALTVSDAEEPVEYV